MAKLTGGHSVLLVDDEADFLESMARALQRRGFEPICARNSGEALNILNRDTVDAAVLDVKMPGMQGDELFRFIQERWPELPVVLLTGHGSVEQAFRTSKQGVFAYLTKPCTVQELAGTLSAALGAEPQSVTSQVVPETSIRVLLVDDEMELLDSLGRALGRKQMQVSMAVSGEQAWTQIENEAPDVVILDLRLPQDEGLSWLRRLKSCHPRIEVIIMTGHPSYGVAHEAMRLGAFDFVIKPLDPARLAELIRAAFSHSQQAVKQRWRTEAEATLKRDPD